MVLAARAATVRVVRAVAGANGAGVLGNSALSAVVLAARIGNRVDPGRSPVAISLRRHAAGVIIAVRLLLAPRLQMYGFLCAGQKKKKPKTRIKFRLFGLLARSVARKPFKADEIKLV
jgi:hypothetical protein